jgi:dihydrofolate synthase / folylpolyglutamate synthase
MPTLTYDQALAFLERFTNYERALRYPYDGWAMNLERVGRLLAALHDPQKNFPVIHLAGTKGKGSTAAMIESILRSAGIRTGLYTSPHLLSFHERIQVNGAAIAEAAVAETVGRLLSAAEAVSRDASLGALTYFEVLTALALAHFAETKVEVAVLEAGLGGRWDATNVCDPAVAVVTPISYDHQDILGDTLEKIATEKAMIIKPGRPAAIGPQPPEALAVLMSRAREVAAPIYRVEEHYRWSRRSEGIQGQTFDMSGDRDLHELFLPLLGDHQLQNAGLAILACDLFHRAPCTVHRAQSRRLFDEEVIRQGLAAVHWPARFEVVGEKPAIVLDGAHNAASARYLAETLGRIFPGRRVLAMIGLGADKDVEGFFRELAPALDAVWLTRSRAMKAAPAERLRAALAGFGGKIAETAAVAEAVGQALAAAGPEDVVLITGSFYVIGEALPALRAKRS